MQWKAQAEKSAVTDINMRDYRFECSFQLCTTSHMNIYVLDAIVMNHDADAT